MILKLTIEPFMAPSGDSAICVAVGYANDMYDLEFIQDQTIDCIIGKVKFFDLDGYQADWLFKTFEEHEGETLLSFLQRNETHIPFKRWPEIVDSVEDALYHKKITKFRFE